MHTSLLYVKSCNDWIVIIHTGIICKYPYRYLFQIMTQCCLFVVLYDMYVNRRFDAMRWASDCVVLTYNCTIQPLEANRSSKVTMIWDHFNEQIKSHLSTHENVLLSAQWIENIWFLPLLVAHMDGAVGSEGTAEIWSRHCICCCDIKSAAYRCSLVSYLQPTMERRWQFWKHACLFHISWAAH